MTSLHDELSQLTATQPVQPGDRLSGVTGRARRIRRTRAATAALSVVAVMGVGAATLTLPGGGSASQDRLAGYPGSAITTWSDRSDRAVVPYSDGAVAAWDPTAAGHVSWVYRGLHEGNNAGDPTQLVMVFRGQQQGLPYLVTATIDKDKVGDGGYALYPDSTNWDLSVTDLTAGVPNNVVIPYFDGNGADVFVLEAPTARTLTWLVHPLPYAEQATTQLSDDTGTSRSARGVFSFRMSKVLGTLTYTVSGAGRTGQGTLPESAVQLMEPDAVTYRGQLVVGSGGPLSKTTEGYAFSFGSSDRTTTGQLAVRCYGGGSLKVETRGRVGSVVCDGRSHDDVLRSGVSGVTEDYRLEFTSDRLQVTTFVLHR
jgi:hypothetical protein